MAGKSSPTKLAGVVRGLAKLVMKLDKMSQSTKIAPRRGVDLNPSNAGPVTRAADKYLKSQKAKKSSTAKMKASPAKAGKAKASPTKIAKAVTKTKIGRKVTKAVKKKAAKKKK